MKYLNKFYELWDSKLRTGVIILFVGFMLTLVLNNYYSEIQYQEQMLKLNIQDSASFKLTNGLTLTIYKHENSSDSTSLPAAGNNN